MNRQPVYNQRMYRPALLGAMTSTEKNIAMAAGGIAVGLVAFFLIRKIRGKKGKR